MNKAQELAQKLIGKDYLEMDETEQELYRAPVKAEESNQEVERLRELVKRLANDELTPAEKKLLLS